MHGGGGIGISAPLACHQNIILHAAPRSPALCELFGASMNAHCCKSDEAQLVSMIIAPLGLCAALP
jgi:hypothetical protein